MPGRGRGNGSLPGSCSMFILPSSLVLFLFGKLFCVNLYQEQQRSPAGVGIHPHHGCLGCILGCGVGGHDLLAAVSNFHFSASAFLCLFFLKITQVLHRWMHWGPCASATGGACPVLSKEEEKFLKRVR